VELLPFAADCPSVAVERGKTGVIEVAIKDELAGPFQDASVHDRHPLLADLGGESLFTLEGQDRIRIDGDDPVPERQIVGGIIAVAHSDVENEVSCHTQS
jgi:hypothetical protein